MIAIVTMGIGIVYGEFDGKRFERKSCSYEKALSEKQLAFAYQTRTDDLKREAEREKAANQRIKENNAKELAQVKSRLIASERMRIRSDLCSDAVSTEGGGSSGGDAGGSSGRVLSEPLDSVFKQLIYETEEVAATARACQAYVESLP